MLNDLSNIVILYFFERKGFFLVLKMIDICRIWRLTPRSCFTLSGDLSH